MDHPALSLIEVTHQVGRPIAEAILRSQAASNPAAAKAIKEIDEERARRKGANVSTGADMAKRLDMSPDQARDLALKLSEDLELFTWLCGRVHQSLASERALAHDE